jgi:hypothetical protein
VPKCFDWNDYELIGPLTLSLGDYTIRAFGCDNTIDRLLEKLKAARQKNESVNWRLMEYWGRGKSTLMYNFCHQVNNRMLFSPNPSPTLALYTKYPQKPQELLDYSYENGLPVPWSSIQNKDEIQNARQDLFRRSLRILAYAWAKKAFGDPTFRNRAARVLPNCKEMAKCNVLEMMEHVDRSGPKDIYETLGKLVLSFVEYSLETNEEIQIPNSFKTHLSGLFFPERTSIFLGSVSKLFGEPGRGLRNFLVFHRMAELAKIHLLVVIDEAEDWNNMAKTKLDEFLITMHPTSRLSVVLILRTEVGRRLRGLQKKFKYYYVRSFMEVIRLSDPDPSEILRIAEGVLSTCRTDNYLKLKPLSEQFTLALSKLTVRGRHFNCRLFLRSLDRILRMSLQWERNGVEIPPNFINRGDLLDAIAENLKIEDRQEVESSLLAGADELQRKKEAANMIGGCLLNGEVNPPSKYMFDIVKQVISDVFGVPVLSDSDVMTYASDENREKVFRMISELRETRVSKRAMDALKERFKDEIGSRSED